ncbi:MAG TPA: amidohydrolase family protein [Vicinamibacteria bacterium]|nr:amidohydrolase family protein [Vicinamibacteria bacterium]
MNRRQALHTMGAAAVGLVARASSAQRAGELLLRGGRVVNADGSRVADVRIKGELIEDVGPDLTATPGASILDATGHLVIPGGIDPHTHLQGSFVDDLTTGTAAAVAGGITTVGTFALGREGESPLAAMERWLDEVSASAIGDVFFHASSWPPSSEFASMLPELASLGQPSHKVFMTRRDFSQYLDAFIELLEAAREAGVVTLMHCEDGAILAAAARRLEAEGRTSLRHYAESRPEIAEVAATAQAVALCELTKAPLHLVHLSSRRSLDAARTPDTSGLPLTIETRPLYLYFTAEWLAGENGPLFVGQPPIRSAADVDTMWQGLVDGRIDFLATDHAPWTRAQKMDPELDIGKLRPGVSDLRFMLPVLYSEGVRKGRLTAERFVEVTSTAAARTFGLFPERGTVSPGSVADIVLLDPDLERIATAGDDPSLSDYTPFEGWAITGWPVLTIRRGEIVYQDGQVVARPGSGKPARRHPRRL